MKIVFHCCGYGWPSARSGDYTWPSLTIFDFDLMLYVHGKQLRSCWDGSLTAKHQDFFLKYESCPGCCFPCIFHILNRF